jgi:voltage-gated potassium channel Kch
LPHISEKINFIYLAVGLVLLLFVGALLEYFPGDTGPMVIQAATVATLLISAWSLRENRSWFVAGIVFVLVMLLMVVGGAVMERTGFSYVHLFIMLCFFIWVTWVVAHQVLFVGGITGNDIVGAICIYLLLGLIWAMLYALIATAVYFSFVTITTLGYGDISPVLPLARFLVYMEAIIGVFYMAILVASLIGVRMSDRDATRKKPTGTT